MKNSILSCIIFVFALLISVNLQAQKPLAFTKKTEDVSKVKAKFDFPSKGKNSNDGKGPTVNVELLNPKPQKVALVSFYLYDPATTKGKAGVASGVGTAAAWATTYYVGLEQVKGFYEKSINELKAGFKEYGIDLLTPEEFLDTEEKRTFYNAFVPETAKKEKTSRGVIGGHGAMASVTTTKVAPTQLGYRVFFTTNEPVTSSSTTAFTGGGILDNNRKMTSSLGYDLCKKLEVDAVVVCYIVTRKEKMKKEDYNVDAVQLYMMGPNPILNSPEDKNRGQYYCGTRYFANAAQFANAKKGTTSYDNIGNVMTALSKKMGNWVINKAKK